MVNTVRRAQISDIPAMVELAEQKRLQYQEYQPTFWRKAANSREQHMSFLERLFGNKQVVAFVHEQEGAVDGFVIASLVSAPPVYDTGGMTCSIDDFWVDGGNHWEDIGKALLEASMHEVKERGAVQTVVVCGHLDQRKRAMLDACGFTIASEWYVRDI